jgi:PAS domain S-box-containing protein
MAGLARAHDWAATPLGPVEAWPQSLRTAVDTCLGSGFASYVWWGRDLIQVYNDAALAILRAKHPAAFAAPAREAWSDVWEVVGPLVERVVGTGEPVLGEDMPMVPERGDPREVAYFTFSYSALRDEAGSVAGMFITAIETTAKVRAEAARREGERRLKEVAGVAGLSSDFRALFEAAPTPFLVLAPPDFRIVAANDAYLRATMTEREAILGRTPFDAFPDDPDEPEATGVRNLRASLDRVLATRRIDVMAVQRYPIRRPAETGGEFEERWWSPINTPVLGMSGEVAAIIHRVEDVTEIVRLRGEAAAHDQLARDQQAVIDRLHESEARFRLMADAVPQIVWITDAEGRAEFFNKRWSDYTGVPYAPMTAAEVAAAFVHPDDAAPTMERFEEARRTGGTFLVEHRIRSKDGDYRWFVVRGEPYRDPATGEIVRWFGASVDIHDRKLAEAALRESEERHRLIVEGARDYAILTTDPEGKIVSWSPGAAAVFGWTAEEAVGQTMVMTFTPEDREGGEPAKELATARREGVAPDVKWHLCKDGSRVFIEGTTRHLSDESGQTRGFLKIGQDVTRRREAEAALRESEERYRLAAEAAGLGHWELIAETGKLLGDDAWRGHHGVSPDSQLDFEGHMRAIHPDDREELRRRVARALEEDDGHEAEYRVVLPDGSPRWILSRGRFVSGDGSAPERLVGVTLDVTDARELERERERLRARELTALAEAAERERISRELHDRVAHSLGVAHQSLELHAALAEGDPSRAEEKLQLARETTRRALDQTRSLAAELKRLQEEELEDGLPAAFEALAQTSVPDGVDVDLDLSGDGSAIPKHVGVQIYLVMREALRNAVRHSGCARLRIRLEVGNGQVFGRVEDDGSGFDPEAVGKASPSWGVGLRSMAERAEMLGGELRVASRPGAGTSVEVRIPLDGRGP